MKMVTDTDAVVAAVRSRKGASAALLALLIEGNGTMLLSVPLALEYEAIATLPEHVMAGGSTMSAVRNLVEVLISIATPVPICFQYRPQLSDAGDEMVLEATINGQANWIITFNARDYKKAGRSIPEDFGITLKTPAEALTILRANLNF